MMSSPRRPALPRTLQQLARGLADDGDRPAIICFRNETAETWRRRDLAQRVEALARDLAERGIGREDPVIVCGPSRPEWIVAFLAVARLGACPVPVDSQFSADTFAHVLEDSGARLVLAAPAAAKTLAGPCGRAGVDVLAFDRFPGPAVGPPESISIPDVSPEDRAVLFYTSGTTGAPKGVPLSHANLTYQFELLDGAKLVTPDDRILLPLPPHHVYPLVVGILAPLALGPALVIPDGFTGRRIVQALRAGEATVIIGVPRLYEALVDGIRSRAAGRSAIAAWLYDRVLGLLTGLRRTCGLRAGRLLLAPLHKRIGPALRTLVSGGAALKPDTAWSLEALGWRVASGYGLTETAPLLALNPPGSPDPLGAGPPPPGTELRIARDQPGDAFGEILARGPGIFAGYLNLPDKTAEAFTGDGWFRTGDLGRLDAAGRLHLAGRRSTLIVTSGGENVQPETVEAAYEADPAIAEIAVFQDHTGIAGLIVADPSHAGADGAEAAVRAAVNRVSRKLPSYQRLGEYRVTREAIPRTRLGKPRRHLLAALYARAGGKDTGGSGAATGAAPLDELSETDRALLEDAAAHSVYVLLGERFPGRRVTPDSDLRLDLGVDSIAWLDLSLTISDRTGVTLAEDAIAGIATVRDLLTHIAEGGGGAAKTASALADPLAALDAEQRRWLAPRGPAARLVGAILAAVNGWAMRRLFRLRVSGLENLPERGPFVLTPNHASYLDPLALAAALDGDRLAAVRWAGWTGILFAGPLSRAVSRAARVLPVDPAGAAASSLAFGAAVLREGGGLIWFPEGARSRNGDLQPFRPGIGMVLEKWPATVVPVVLRGTFDAWPPGRRWPRLRPIEVRFLAAEDSCNLVDEGEGDTPALRLVDALRRRIGAALADGRPASPAPDLPGSV